MTRTEDIRRLLEDEIVSGLRAPGTPLEEVDLAVLFSVSRTPIREALRQLEADGFAQSRPRRGAVVSVRSPEQLAQMFFAMAELEAVCGKLAANSMTAIEITKLDQVRRDCENAVEQDAIDAYQDANDRFHDLIYDASHNEFLGDLTRSVRRRVAPYRRAQFLSSGRLQQSLAEHNRIVDKIRKREADATATELRAHIFTVEHAFYLRQK